MRAYTTTSKGLAFTACREALVTVAYQDGQHCSVGFGTNDPTLKVGDRVTVRRAFELLRDGVRSREDVVNRALNVNLAPHQFDAVVDFYYQNGNKPDDQGRPGFRHMMGLINSGDLDAAHDYFERCYLTSSGERSAGLLKRRRLEQMVFRDADYGDVSSVMRWDEDPRDKTNRPTTYHFQPGDLE